MINRRNFQMLAAGLVLGVGVVGMLILPGVGRQHDGGLRFADLYG